jgi:2-polyprenyl-3-methyl-5-hydroxy-6-metoxy-1,4-benzoquinol methylase
MRFEERIPDELFKGDHYLGRPADFDDKIVQRRVALVREIPGFTGKNLNLLDIGCGNGASMFLLADEFASCLGLEVETAHQDSFENYKEQHQINNCDFRIFDIENQQLARQFDRIISFEVIEHLHDDKNVSFFYKHLKPGGIAAISVPNKWWIFETHGAKLPLLPWNRVPFFSWLPRPIHEHFANARIYTKKRIKNLLENAGFQVERIEYITAPLDVLKNGKLKTWLVNNIFKNDVTKVPFLATSLFVVARK